MRRKTTEAKTTPVAPEAPPANIISIKEIVEKDRQARVARAAKAVNEILVSERVALTVAAFDFVEGRLFPKFVLRPTEPAAAA